MRQWTWGSRGRSRWSPPRRRGSGCGCARALSDEGCRVAINGHDPGRLDAASTALPGEVLALTADVTDPATPAALVDATVERFGGLDILVANARRAAAGARARAR